MQIIGQIFDLIFFGPIVNALVLIIRTLESLHIPGALGLSIIILSVLIRFLVWPFMTSQLKSAKKMAELKPHLDALKVKHKDDKQAFAASQMALYKEHGVNPAGGCVPALIQFPILIALYQAIYAFFQGPSGLEKINKLLYFPTWHLNAVPDLNFFGINLTIKPSEVVSKGLDFSNPLFLLLLIPIITALLQLIQARMMAPKPVPQYKTDSPKEKKEKESTDDSMAAVQSQMMFMMPLMIGYFAFQFPIGLALYWNTTTIFSIVQQYFVSGLGGLESWLQTVGIVKKS